MTMRVGMCSRPAIAALVVALGVGTAFAQQGGMNSQQPGGAANTPGSMNTPGSQPGGMNSTSGMNSMASPMDRMFLQQAAEGDMFEIHSSQLALQKSNSADVKQFAHMMIQDHEMLDDKMKPIAEQAGVQPPSSLRGKPAKEYARLQGLSGDAFDQAYIKDMVMDHEKVDRMFANEASNGQLPDEKMAAEQNKPIIDMHLQKAEALAKAHNVTVSGM